MFNNSKVFVTIQVVDHRLFSVIDYWRSFSTHHACAGEKLHLVLMMAVKSTVSSIPLGKRKTHFMQIGWQIIYNAYS